MSTSEELRELASGIRKAAEDLQTSYEAAQGVTPEELDVQKVRDFLTFYGDTTNG